MLEHLLRTMIESLVDMPEIVEITSVEEEGRGTVFLVRVDPSDFGKVIGEHGNTANAIRKVLKAASWGKYRRRVFMIPIDERDDLRSNHENKEQS